MTITGSYLPVMVVLGSSAFGFSNYAKVSLFKVYLDFEKHFEVLTLEETIKKTEEVSPWLQVIQKIKTNTN